MGHKAFTELILDSDISSSTWSPEVWPDLPPFSGQSTPKGYLKGSKGGGQEGLVLAWARP